MLFAYKPDPTWVINLRVRCGLLCHIESGSTTLSPSHCHFFLLNLRIPCQSKFATIMLTRWPLDLVSQSKKLSKAQCQQTTSWRGIWVPLPRPFSTESNSWHLSEPHCGGGSSQGPRKEEPGFVPKEVQGAESCDAQSGERTSHTNTRSLSPSRMPRDPGAKA